MKTKKNLLLFSTLIIASAFIFSCSPNAEKKENNNNVKHYRHILFSETEYDQIQGTYPISEEEANEINNYKFTYDGQNRLISVEYVRGDELLGYSSLGAAKIVMEYNDNKETRYFFDKNGNPINHEGVYKYVFTYDENGVKTGLKFYDKDGNPVENRNKIANYEWKVLDNGMVRENRYNMAGEETIMNEFCPFYELRFTYDDRGYVKRMANYQADTMYNCTVENCGDVGVSYFLFKISDEGNLEEFSVHNTVGQYSNLYWGWARLVNKYDEYGNVIERASYDQDNEYVGGRAVPVYQYKYDKHGAVIEVSCMDKDRNLINNSRGVAITKYEYLEDGQPSDTTMLDKDMNIYTQES